MIEDITKRSLDDVRAAYKKYLNGQGLSINTIMTSSTDAFYIWRKQGANLFWNVVFSNSFEALGKETLLELLRQQSSGNAESNVNGYMAHCEDSDDLFKANLSLKYRKLFLVFLMP